MGSQRVVAKDKYQALVDIANEGAAEFDRIHDPRMSRY
jgi:hypothetical protein